MTREMQQQNARIELTTKAIPTDIQQIQTGQHKYNTKYIFCR